MSNLLRKGKRLATFQKPRSSFSTVRRARAFGERRSKPFSKSRARPFLGRVFRCTFMGADGETGAPSMSKISELKFISLAADVLTAGFPDASTTNWEG